MMDTNMLVEAWSIGSDGGAYFSVRADINVMFFYADSLHRELEKKYFDGAVDMCRRAAVCQPEIEWIRSADAWLRHTSQREVDGKFYLIMNVVFNRGEADE